MSEMPQPRSEQRQKLLVNLGCGPKGEAALPALFADWRELRVDIDPTAMPDVLADVTDLSAIESGVADAVWTAHCIEHLYLHQVNGAIGEMHRILGDQGFLCLVVPDLQGLAEYIANDRLHEVVYQAPAGAVTAHDMIFGYEPFLARGQLAMAHKCGFTPSLLLQKLQQVPFAEIVLHRRSNHELIAVARKQAPADDAERNAFLAALGV